MFTRKPVCLGVKTVVTNGTRIQLTTTDTRTPWVFIQALEGNDGIVYVGMSDVASTKYIIALGAGEGFELTAPQVRGTQGEYILSDFWIDASTTDESVQVTYDGAR